MASVLTGPWTQDSLGNAPWPDRRAGRLLPQRSRCTLFSIDFHPLTRRMTLQSREVLDERPPLQLNLPFPDMPTLGAIARDHRLVPRKPRQPIPADASTAVRRHLEFEQFVFILSIDPLALLMDPDWYVQERRARYAIGGRGG